MTDEEITALVERLRRWDPNPGSMTAKTADAIEHLIAERDEWKAAAGGKVFCALLTTGVCDQATRAEKAKAALAKAREGLAKIEQEGTRTFTDRVGDMYDPVGGYQDNTEVSVEAETARDTLAAIDALIDQPAPAAPVVPREPTDGMIEAGAEALQEGADWRRQVSPADVWEAMYDAALAQEIPDEG